MGCARENNILTENQSAENHTSKNTSQMEESFMDTTEQIEEATVEPIIMDVDWSDYFEEINGSAVIYNPAEHSYQIYNQELANTRRSPCSTFKIISSLIALEKGIVEPDNSTRTWSGEIFWNEVMDIVNVGKNCIGLGNSGYCNSGNYNSGNYNSGNHNSGYYNSGDYNSGNGNSGKWNRGNHNSGNRNNGKYNSGDYNSGNWNSGDWNVTNCSNGCFNTIEQKIFLFNKISDWTMKDWRNSEARTILYDMMVSPIQKIDEKDMTEKEKEEYPEYQTTGFYLKKLSLEEIAEERQKCWNELSQEQKDIVMAIPNFDKAIFKETTGIDVDMEE